MQDRLTVRIVQETDAHDLRENIYTGNTLNEVKERVASKLHAYAAEKGVPLVAEVDAHVVGIMDVTFDEHPLRAHICRLSDVVVNAGFQRRGIARRLFEECKTRALEKGKRIMCVSVRGGTTAETVYRKLGFIEYGRLPDGLIESPPFWPERQGFDEVLFYMPLAAADDNG